MADNREPLAGETALTGAELVKEMGFWKVVAEDFRTHQREWSSPGLQTLFIYRVGTWASNLPRIVSLPFLIFYALGFRFCRGFYGIELRRSVRLGRRFRIGHQHGIIIHRYATFGNDCTVRQCVTFGASNEWIVGEGPIIGSNVSFSPGCVILGNIRIGDRVQVGPNCVVSADVPSDRILFVPPPRTLPRDVPTSEETQEDSQ